jgi:hypothetical protein
MLDSVLKMTENKYIKKATAVWKYAVSIESGINYNLELHLEYRK